MMSGGTLNNTGGLTLNGLFAWTDGIVTGSGILTTSTGAITTVSGVVTLANTGWDNFGTIDLTDAARIVLGGGDAALATTLTNKLGGTFNDNSTNATPLASLAPTTNKRFVNEGIFNKNLAAADEQTISAPMTNTGRINLRAGTLFAIRFPVNSGIVELSPDTVFATAGAGLTNSTGARIEGDGTVNLSGATLANNGILRSTDLLDVQGNLALNGGIIDGAGRVVVSGTTTVTGGTSTIEGRLTTSSLLIPSGVLDVARAGILDLNGGGEKTVTGTLSNFGTVNATSTSAVTVTDGGLWDNSGVINLLGATRVVLGGATTARLVNNAGGTINDVSSAAAPISTGTATKVGKSFANAGTFVKDVLAANVQTLDVPMTNTRTDRYRVGDARRDGLPGQQRHDPDAPGYDARHWRPPARQRPRRDCCCSIRTPP